MQATISEIIQETPDISSFRLTPQEKLKYIPGQWMYVRLSPELKHHFTISSSPSENFLQFTTKNTGSEYKITLWQRKVGDPVEITGAFGSFLLDERDLKPRLFIAGGIGITPFRSMMRYVRDMKLNIDITLLYSVKNMQEAAFASLEGAKVIETEKSGRLDENKIKTLVPDWQERSWWLCGPPVMVETTVELAQKMGVSPDDLKSEEFTGYL